MRGQHYTMRHSIPEAQNGQQQQPNTAIGPCVTEMNTQCLDGANLEMRGEEKDLYSMPATTKVQQHGVSKRHEESHSRVHTIHNRSLSAVLDCSARLQEFLIVSSTF